MMYIYLLLTKEKIRCDKHLIKIAITINVKYTFFNNL